MSNELRDHMFQWAAVTNLNFVTQFHNEVRRMIGNSLVEIGDREDNDAVRLKARFRRLDRVLQTNTFLMTYSYAEEWLFLLCTRTSVKPSNSSSICRFKAPLTALGADLSGAEWELMRECEILRNCLLHANGRIDLCRDREKVERIVAKYPKEMEIADKRLQLEPTFVERFGDSLHRFLTKAGTGCEQIDGEGLGIAGAPPSPSS